MIDIVQWLLGQPQRRLVELFDVVPPGVVRTTAVGRTRRRTLCRSSEMERAIVELVEDGLATQHFEGLLYVMGHGGATRFRPLYVGKAERRGVKHPLSANLVNLRADRGKFARWGDGLDYHIGDLSHALFGWPARRTPLLKYRRWAEALFVDSDPPRLREAVHLYLLPWHHSTRGPSGLLGSLAAVEKEVIALAAAQHPRDLLNSDGR